MFRFITQYLFSLNLIIVKLYLNKLGKIKFRFVMKLLFKLDLIIYLNKLVIKF